MKMAKDRTILSMAQAKLIAFQEALQQIRTSTGYEDLQDIIDLFNKYEDEKFNKVGAANRMVVDIERLEKDVAEMRSEVQVRDAQTAITKQARINYNTSLETTAAQMEAQLIEVNASVTRMMEEVKVMFPIIDFAFYAIGSDRAFEVPTGSSSPTKAQSHGSPLRSKTASLKMYTGNPAMKEDVKSGVTASSLSQFMGIIESRSADIIQQYAVSSNGLEISKPSRSSSPVPEFASTSTQRFPMSPANALGPSRPTGKLKESLTSSALIAALAVDSTKMEAPDGDREDERPISLEELKRQAARQMEGDKNFKAVRSAALQAATILTRG